MKPHYYLLLTLLFFQCTDNRTSPPAPRDLLNDTTIVLPDCRDAVGDPIIRYGQPFFFTFANTDIKPEMLAESFSLVINNKHFPHYKAKQFFQTNDRVQLMFVIDHNDGEGQNLAKFLGPKRASVQTVRLDVVRDGARVAASPEKGVTIEFYSEEAGNYVKGFAAVIIILLIWLGWKSNLLKHEVPTVNLWRWSLGKTQLAVWTMTIAVLYLLIWIVTFAPPFINQTVLALLGISFLTTAIASSQGSGKELISSSVVKKTNFFLDLIDDGNGASIHRFQNVVFIGVFVYIFISGTIANLQFPTFDDTQLGLLGISSAGYLGMKFLKEK